MGPPNTFQMLALVFYTLAYFWTSVAGEGVLMVQTCRGTKGDGRCVPSPECCKLVGGSIINPFADKTCGSKEVCCFLVPTTPDTDKSCATCASLGDRDVPLSTTARPAADVELPASDSDDQSNLIRALSANPAPNVRDDSSPQVNFFARSADMGFGVPYRIERTIYDKDAIKNTYCWQVALVDSSGKVFGGGALISRNYVLTAAHKVANRLPQTFQVVLGKYDFKDQEEDSRIASPLEVIIHEKWDAGAFENNVALIRIPNVQCNSGDVCTVCPSNKPMDPVAQAQDICFVTGWGSTYTKGDLAKLQQNQIRPILKQECVAGLSRSNIQDFNVPKSMFCGSSSDPDHLACDGDGGGPLVCMQSGTWTWELRGLVALGVSQCTNVTDAPTVYVDVGKLSGWIGRKIQQVESEKKPWLPRVPSSTTVKSTTATIAPTTPAWRPERPPMLNRRTNDNSLSFSYVFPSFLRHLDDSTA